jgi:magnesium transporter
MNMTVNCYKISDGPKLTPCEYSFAIEAIRQQKARIWIDLLDAENGEIEEKLDDIQVQGLIRDFCLDSRDHPGFYPFKPLALMVIPVQMEVQNSNIMEYLAVLFSNDFLITIRNSKMARFRKSISSEDSFDLLPDNSIAGVISTLMMGLSLDCLRKAAGLSDMILALEAKMESDPDAVKIEEISAKRSELLTLESIVQGQLPIIMTTISSDRPSKNPESSLEYLRWAAANLKSADRKLEWLERRIEVMRSLIDMHAQDRTNRRLGRLTILSMIFMPVTFLAGIWGMNFKSMPLLSLDYGYILALIIMLLISAGMYFYFHRKGWFD